MTGSAPRIIVFGAGNIGRSFIGQLFARGGWEVVFVDVDAGLVAALNERRSYRVLVKREGKPDEALQVEGLRAVDGRDLEAVARELAAADLAATAVGKAALPKLLPALARGLLAREAGAAHGAAHGATYGRPLDLILAENDRDAVRRVKEGLATFLPEGFPLAERLGLVETSIGKMVPIMRAEDLAVDRLLLFAEEYDSLIVDRKGFLGPLPAVRGLEPVDNISAYVERKLFVHNLGHAAVAYFGYRADPAETLVCRAIALPGVRRATRRAMGEAADALAAAYPADLDRSGLEAHIEDLLRRFGNFALGDTVYRVGRDLPRKLHRSDRILGAALLCERLGLPWEGIAAVFEAALGFAATDEEGRPFPADAEFQALYAAGGIDAVLRGVCMLDPGEALDARVMAALRG